MTRYCRISLVAALLVLSTTAMGLPVTPTFDTFGALPAATFGGSGIPNDAVAIAELVDGDVTITLGLTATPRYANPSVTNDWAGTFEASPGSDPSISGYALWNFDWYVGFVNSGTAPSTNTYIVDLRYDLDPAFYTDESALVTGSFVVSGDSAEYQDSWNLGMNFLSGGTFDPTALGQYSFVLAVSRDGGPSDSVAINVNTGAAPVLPEPATTTVFGLGLAGMAVAGWRKKRNA